MNSALLSTRKVDRLDFQIIDIQDTLSALANAANDAAYYVFGARKATEDIELNLALILRARKSEYKQLTGEEWKK